jgi:hypothetical protein
MAKLKLSRLTILISVFVSITVVVLVLTTYFVFFYERVAVDSIAEEFCACAESSEVKASQLVLSREEFLYHSGINSCFGKAFASVDDPLTYEEELEYVVIIRDRIFEKCPNSLGNLFSTAELTGE